MFSLIGRSSGSSDVQRALRCSASSDVQTTFLHLILRLFIAALFISCDSPGSVQQLEYFFCAKKWSARVGMCQYEGDKRIENEEKSCSFIFALRHSAARFKQVRTLSSGSVPDDTR
jgi:hypothetical protein